MTERLLVTGGAGFIGSALVRHLVRHTPYGVVNIDALTYAGNLQSVSNIEDERDYVFERVDIRDSGQLREVFETYRPKGVLHLAAESHVDRSIDRPADFVETNVVGTYNLLEVAARYWEDLERAEADFFRFVHVSTDEVYGSLGNNGHFTEESRYDPRSPYAASKAGSDHLARAWYHTYGLPTIVTNTSNNFGPYQFPEKLIPLVIDKALKGENIPVFGTGENVRDWIYVEDHVRALIRVFEEGRPGATYLIGARNERRNLDVVKAVCTLMDRLVPNGAVKNHASLITFVEDRPGHDWRYAIDPSRVESELGWTPEETFESGLEKTVRWYLNNQEWCEEVMAGSYGGERLGTRSA